MYNFHTFYKHAFYPLRPKFLKSAEWQAEHFEISLIIVLNICPYLSQSSIFSLKWILPQSTILCSVKKGKLYNILLFLVWVMEIFCKYNEHMFIIIICREKFGHHDKDVDFRAWFHHMLQ